MATKTSSQRKLYSFTIRERVNQGPWYQVGGGDSFDRTIAASFSGVSNPGWHRQVARGQNATTIASGTMESILVSPGGRFVSYQAPGQLVERDVSAFEHARFLSSPPDFDPSLSASVRNAVLTRFLLRCLSEQRKLQGGVVLGELRKTIELIRNPLKGIETLTTAYADSVRGRSRGLSPRLIPRILNQEYLSYTYGVLPLLSDIKGAYATCLRLRDLPELVKVRAFAQDEKQTLLFSGTTFSYDIPAHYERVASVKCSSIIRGAVKVKSVGPVPPLQESLGFKLRDFIPTVYELIPYSFLLDYMVNVGDILNCLAFCQGDLAWHCSTHRALSSNQISFTPARPDNMFGHPVMGYSLVPCKAQWTQKSWSRDALPLGLPSLVFKLPSQGQSVNIAALALARVL